MATPDSGDSPQGRRSAARHKAGGNSSDRGAALRGGESNPRQLAQGMRRTTWRRPVARRRAKSPEMADRVGEVSIILAHRKGPREDEGKSMPQGGDTFPMEGPEHGIRNEGNSALKLAARMTRVGPQNREVEPQRDGQSSANQHVHEEDQRSIPPKGPSSKQPTAQGRASTGTSSMHDEEDLRS